MRLVLPEVLRHLHQNAQSLFPTCNGPRQDHTAPRTGTVRGATLFRCALNCNRARARDEVSTDVLDHVSYCNEDAADVRNRWRVAARAIIEQLPEDVDLGKAAVEVLEQGDVISAAARGDCRRESRQRNLAGRFAPCADFGVSNLRQSPGRVELIGGEGTFIAGARCDRDLAQGLDQRAFAALTIERGDRRETCRKPFIALQRMEILPVALKHTAHDLHAITQACKTVTAHQGFGQPGGDFKIFRSFCDRLGG